MALLGNIDAPLEEELSPNSPVNNTPKNPMVPDQDKLNELALASQDTGFMDNVFSSFDYFKKVGTEPGRQAVVTDQVNNDLKVLRENNLIPPELEDTLFLTETPQLAKAIGGLVNPLSLLTSSSEQDTTDAYLDFIRSNPEFISDIKKKNPDIQLKTYQDIQQDTVDEFAAVTNKQNEIAKRSGFMGSVGQFIGAAGAYMSDPINAALTLSPAGVATKGVAFLTNFAKVSASTAISIAAQELFNKPGEVVVRNVLGEDVSTSQALTESAITVGAGATLVGVLGHIGTLLGRTDISPTVRAELEDAQGIVKDTMSLLKDKPYVEVSDIDYERAVGKILQDVAASKEPDISKIIPGAARFTPPTLSGSITDATKAITSSTDDAVTKAKFDEIFTSLKTEDKTFDVVDSMGNKSQVSIRSQFEAVQNDRTAYEEISKCLVSGAINVST